MATADAKDEDNVSCPICFEPYRQAQSLKCGHLLCTPCIDHILEENGDDLLQCSFCRAICQKHELRRIYAMDDVVDNYLMKQAEASRPQVEEKTQEEPKNPFPVYSFCEVCTQKPFTFKCEPCAELMCDQCTDLHKTFKVSKNHKMLTLDDIKAPIREKLKALITDSEAMHGHLKQRNEAFMKCSRSISHVANEALTKLSHLRRDVNAKLDDMCQKIKDAEAQEITQLASAKRENEENQKITKTGMDLLSDMLSRDDTNTLCKPELVQELQQNATLQRAGDEVSLQTLLNKPDFYRIEVKVPEKFRECLDEVSVMISLTADDVQGVKQRNMSGIYRYNDNGMNALHEAAKAGNDEEVVELLRLGTHVDVPTQTGSTALHLSIQAGRIQCAETLIKHGASIEELGQTVMAMYPVAAKEEGNLELKKNEIYDVIDSTKEHWWKAKNSQGEIGYIPSNYVKVLGNSNPRELKKKTALQIAVEVRNPEITKMLLDVGAKTDVLTQEGLFPVHIAAKNGDHYIVDMLLKQGAYRLNATDITLGEKIYEGEYGSIWKGSYRSSVDVAVTQPNLEPCDIQNTIRALHLHHKNLTTFYGFYGSYPTYSVLEYTKKGNFRTFLREQHTTAKNNKSLLLYSFHVCEAMRYLESQNFVYKELMTFHCSVSENEIVKIKFLRSWLWRDNDNDYDELRKQSILGRWMAPETIRNGKCDSKSDVWSYGVTLWEIWSGGNRPYNRMTNSAVMQKVLSGYVLDQPVGCPSSVWKIMRACWNMKPENRPTFSDLYEDLQRLISMLC